MNSNVVPSIKNKVIKGAAWMVVSRWSFRLLGLVSTMVLARLLTPADFGLVAVVVSLTAILGGLFDFGFDMALIRQQNPERDDYDSAWTFRFLKASVFAIAILFCSPWVAEYANAPEAVHISIVTALTFFVRSFENIGTVNFQKNLAFHSMFKYMLYPRLLGVASTIALAFALRSYWAIVLGTLLNAVYQVIFSYLLCNDYLPRFSFRGFAKLWGFSKWVLVNSISRQIFSAMDRLLLSGHVSKQSLGYYSVGADLASIVTQELMTPVGSALMPGYAKLKHDHERLRSAFLVSTSVFIALILPTGVGVWLIAPELVALLLGAQWTQAAGLTGLLALFFMCYATTEILTNFLAMVDLIERSSVVGIVRTLLFILLIYFAFQAYHLEGVIFLKIALSAIEVLALLVLALRYLQLSVMTISTLFWRPLLAVTCMAVVVELLPLSAALPVLLTLILKVAVAAMVYAGASVLLWLGAGKPKGLESMLVELTQLKLSRAS